MLNVWAWSDADVKPPADVSHEAQTDGILDLTARVSQPWSWRIRALTRPGSEAARPLVDRLLMPRATLNA